MTRKITTIRVAFSTSFGGLQPSASTVGPFGPNNRAIWDHLKMFKIHLQNYLEYFGEISLKFFAEIHLEVVEEICLVNF